MVPNKKMLPSQNVSKVLDIKRKNNWLANVAYKTWKELAVHKNTYGVNVMRNDTHDNGGSKKKRNQNFDAFLAPLVSIACRLWSPTITCGRAIRPVLSTRDEEIAVKAFSASAIARERAPFSPPRLSLVVLAPGVVIPFLLLFGAGVAWQPSQLALEQLDSEILGLHRTDEHNHALTSRALETMLKPWISHERQNSPPPRRAIQQRQVHQSFMTRRKDAKSGPACWTERPTTSSGRCYTQRRNQGGRRPPQNFENIQ